MFLSAEDNHFRINIEDAVSENALDDSRAEFSARDKKTFEKVRKCNPGASVRKLKTPLELSGAFNEEDGNTFTISITTILTVTTYIMGLNIPGRVRGITF